MSRGKCCTWIKEKKLEHLQEQSWDWVHCTLINKTAVLARAGLEF
jgi:hypothetical protein